MRGGRIGFVFGRSVNDKSLRGRWLSAAVNAVAFIAVQTIPPQALAQSGAWTWAGGTGRSWSTAANWNAGTVADGSGNTATFQSASSGTTVLDTNRTIGNISQNNANTRAIDGPSFTLTLATAAGSTPTLSGTTGSTLSMTPIISGSQGFRKTGTSTLNLTGANTFSGTALLQSGTTVITNVAGLGASGVGNETVISSTAQLQIATGLSPLTVAESFSIAGRGNAASTSPGAIRIINSNVTLSGNIAISGSSEIAPNTNSTLTISGNVTGTGGAMFRMSGSLTVSGNMSHAGWVNRITGGSGVLTLSGSNSYNGSTSIDNTFFGSVILGGPYAIPTTSRLSLTEGATLDLNGNSITIPTFGWRDDGASPLQIENSSGGVITDNSAGSGTTTITVTSGSFVLGTAINDGSGGRKLALRVAGDNLSRIEISGTLSNGSAAPSASATFSEGLTIMTGPGNGTRLRIEDPIVNIVTNGTLQSSLLGTGTVTVGLAPADKAQFYMGPKTVVAGVGSTVLNDFVFNTDAGTDTASGVLLNATEAIFAGKLVAGQATVSFATGAQVPNSVAVLTGRVTSTGASGGLRLVGNGQIPGITVRLNNQTGTPNDYQGTTAIEGNTTLVLGAADQVPNGAGKGNVSISTSGTFNLNGFSDTINGLTGSGGVDGSSGTPTLTVGDGDATASFSGVIRNAAGTLSFTKIGSGVQTLSGANTYSGPTSVDAGTLLVNGNQSGATGAVTVASGATLGGSGTIGGAVTVDGILSPGNSPGVLTVPSLSLGASSTAIFEINTTARGTGYDGVNISGASGPAYGGALSLVFGNVSAFAANTIFDLFNFSGSPSSNFTSVASTGFYSGTWSLDGDAWLLVSGTQTLSFTPANGDLTVTATVPEPATIALLGGLALGWQFVRGRRRSSQGTSRGTETG